MRRAQPEARAEFFRRYAPQVRRILFLQGLCDEVDDAVQEVFIKVFRADLPAEERFLAWFYRLILNTGRDQGRRRKTRRGLVERLEELAPADRAPGAAAVADDPAQRAAAADPALRAALDGLAPDFRETVALRFFADLSLESIAAAQDVPLGTVKSRLHMALLRLRRALTEAGFERG
jgi:RNA polymerase sigma-70 factor (ECF subfamily)